MILCEISVHFGNKGTFTLNIWKSLYVITKCCTVTDVIPSRRQVAIVRVSLVYVTVQQTDVTVIDVVTVVSCSKLFRNIRYVIEVLLLLLNAVPLSMLFPVSDKPQ